jgi:glyoxylase-like metal-dependent hydrolase (beta-lactamase superfamily II)
MATEQWKIGNVTVTKVEEVAFWESTEFLGNALPASTPQELDAIDWMTPTYLKDGMVNMSIHSFLVETPTKKFVVDTGIGNDKNRMVDLFSSLNTDFLDRFSEIWDPAEVDGVICTHLHVDHVGWNTRLIDGSWVPTFPNAEYLFVRKEFDHWKNYSDTSGAEAKYSEWAHAMVDGVAVFEDSIAPIADAGLISWVEPDGPISPEIRLIPTHGHTPGHVGVLIESEGESAVITGDLMHCPCQVARHDWSASLDSDQHASAETRHAFVQQFADSPTVVLGTHFGTPSGGHIVRNGESYKFVALQ